MLRSRLFALLTAIAVIAVAIGLGVYTYSNSLQARLSEARSFYRQGDNEQAAELLDSLVVDHPDDVDVRKLAVEVAIESQDLEATTKHIDGLANVDGRLAASFASEIAKANLATEQFDEAELWFARVIEMDPDDAEAASELANLLTNQGRRWEALPLLTKLIQSDQYDVEQLLLAARTEDMIALPPDYVSKRRADRSQISPLLGVARFGLATNDYKLTDELLCEVIKAKPELIEARLRLCELQLVTQRDEFVTEFLELPVEAQSHPVYWVLAGKWFRRMEAPKLAVAAFRESLLRDPNRNVSTFQLSQLLAQLGYSDAAEQFRLRSDELRKLSAELVTFFRGDANLNTVRDVSKMLKNLGRYREALAWAKHARFETSESWPGETIAELDSLVDETSPCVVKEKDPTRLLAAADWPTPTLADIERIAGSRESTGSSGTSTFTPIQLSNVASDLGVEFKYFNGAVPNSEEHRMYEFTGGGVGVIDFDLDGWPEFYLPNGTKWPPQEPSEYSDALFRNQQSSFSNVTDLAGIHESAFGQGVTVGDVNNDGFPDLYVANTHGNQLWHNNGDGTFTDVTDLAGLTTSVWTTSCVIADFNGDGLPDIYDVNFLTGDDVWTRICDEDGRPRSCPPAEFPGEQDRVFLSRGDGTFSDVTETAGIVRPRGNGLGIIAADFDGSRKLNLFLANDSVPNFYYQNNSTSDSIVFDEAAVLAGLDVNYAGKSQACMGVGFADVDGNGLPDLFITNFHNESNALYLQQDANLFSDECQPANVRALSQTMLGFGTQFIDINLNTRQDLVITNGHVDDYTHSGADYQMRPQILRLAEDITRFEEQTPTSPDAYFSGKHLGRGLARLDFNRDGLADYGVQHLDSPFALIRNQTTEHGNFLSVKLVATSTARDAIGARVRVTTGDKTLVHQLSAGDGYMASNERRLIIGLGEWDEECKVGVDWMSGEQQDFGSLAVNSRVTLVEGAYKPFEDVR